RHVSFAKVERFATPRRIAARLETVARSQPERLIQRDGPSLATAVKDGVPTRAGLGFAKSCGVPFETLGQRNGKLYFEHRQAGAETQCLVPEVFAEALAHMDTVVPKRMHWGDSEAIFVRPVHWLVALFGGEIVPLEHFDLHSGRITYGHRFHAPQAIELQDGCDYDTKLRAAHVWVDIDSRRTEIRRQIEGEAARLGGRARIPTDLLDEVTSLVEWPVVIAGRVEQRFMELPPEVIVATVETNQRYFTISDAQGKLLPAFITISNIESKDPAQVIAGNERVVRPRLADGLFFWRQDLRKPLADYAVALKDITFQKKLGSLAAKVARTAQVAEVLATAVGVDPGAARRAAQLCKNDLATQMVHEFPELQGIMGGYYALKSGAPEAVAHAIRDHYLPTQQGGEIPATREGQAVALADKLDTLAGYFAVGQKPTASKDPFALRRAALGVVRILVEGSLDLDLREWLAATLGAQPAGDRDQTTLDELIAFVLERQRAWSIGRKLGSRAIDAESYEAVAQLGLTRPLDIERRLQALLSFSATTAARSLAAADKRARNLLKQASDAAATTDNASFGEPAEHALDSALNATDSQLAPLRAQANYHAMLETLAKLKEPVDRFFDEVRIMADDPAVRATRIGLLRRLDHLCREVADLSKLPG
ncbi:MAG TPA: glycine--tRNA ligase subunit beta, partial [Nevskiaceae bacterium]|nr:glycine--tRNA ligase subunit beta [Nevskiaceae bacterium]